MEFVGIPWESTGVLSGKHYHLLCTYDSALGVSSRNKDRYDGRLVSLPWAWKLTNCTTLKQRELLSVQLRLRVPGAYIGLPIRGGCFQQTHGLIHEQALEC